MRKYEIADGHSGGHPGQEIVKRGQRLTRLEPRSYGASHLETLAHGQREV